MRDETLARAGITVLRLSADDVVRDLPSQLSRIIAHVATEQ
jgi:very-short-patch-repair endonuclease